MEQSQLLLRLPVMWHLVFVFAALLSECTGAIMNPLVTVYLFASTAAASASASASASAAVVLVGESTARGGVETAVGKNEGAAAGTRGGVDNGVNSRLLYGFLMYQLSERSWSSHGRHHGLKTGHPRDMYWW